MTSPDDQPEPKAEFIYMHGHLTKEQLQDALDDMTREGLDVSEVSLTAEFVRNLLQEGDGDE